MPSTYSNTDSCEAALISFLFNLNDLNDNYYDQLHLSDTKIFTICCSMNDGIGDNVFNKFYLKLLSDTTVDNEKVTTLLAYYHLTARTNEIYFNQVGTSKYLNTSYVDNHTYYNYDHIEYLFYDAYEDYQFTIVTNDTNYPLTTSDIFYINNLSGNTFYVRAKFVYASADPNSYYFSNLISFSKSVI